MRRAATTGILAVLVAYSAAVAEEQAGGSTTDADRSAAQQLLAEKTRLEKEVAFLREQVEVLALALAGTQSQTVSRAVGGAGKADTGAGNEGPTGQREGSPRIVDVNEGLRMLALGAGYEEGIRPGMTFAVQREGKVIARVRVVDVRERISGAVVDEVKSNVFPTTDDRILRVAAEDTRGMGQWKR